MRNSLILLGIAVLFFGALFLIVYRPTPTYPSFCVFLGEKGTAEKDWVLARLDEFALAHDLSIHKGHLGGRTYYDADKTLSVNVVDVKSPRQFILAVFDKGVTKAKLDALIGSLLRLVDETLAQRVVVEACNAPGQTPPLVSHSKSLYYKSP